MTHTHADVILVQPSAQGRLSGGYLYNRRMADGGTWTIVDVEPHNLKQQLATLVAGAVAMDSIWLTREHFAAFLSIRERGIPLGTILHSLPSMIAAAEAGGPLTTAPTEDEWAMLAELDFIAVVGPHFERMLGARGIQTVPLPPGVDRSWHRAPRSRRGACRLVSVGAVTPRKGFLDLAQVLVQIQAMDVAWTVVGSLDVDPVYARDVQRCAAPLGDARAAFLGQLPPDEVRRHVQAAHLLVMPSYDENHPLVLLEAMAASVPCVAYRAGAAQEILGDVPPGAAGARGVTLPIGDTDALQRELTRLVANESTRRALAAACQRHADTLPSWSEASEAASRTIANLLRL